jgi:hypothetical protein
MASFHHELTVKAKAIINVLRSRSRPVLLCRVLDWRPAGVHGSPALPDYDGIIAGAPVYRVIEPRAARLDLAVQSSDPTGAHAIPASKLPAIFRAVIEACDHLDGPWTPGR